MPRKRKNKGHGRDLGYGAANGKMLRNQLASVRRSATSLRNALNDQDKVPSWVLSKASVALSDLQAAESYILSKLEGYNKNPAYRANKAEKAKGFAAFIKKVAKAFGAGAKKAAVATAHLTKVSTLKAKILKEKNYMKTLLKYGKQLEVSDTQVKGTKAYRNAKQRVSDYEDRIDQLERDYKAAKSKKNPHHRDSRAGRGLRVDIPFKITEYSRPAQSKVDWHRWGLEISAGSKQIKTPPIFTEENVSRLRMYAVNALRDGENGIIREYKSRQGVGSGVYYHILQSQVYQPLGAPKRYERLEDLVVKKEGAKIAVSVFTLLNKEGLHDFLFGFPEIKDKSKKNPKKKAKSKKKGLKPALQRRINEANYYIDYANKHSLLVYDKSSTWPIRIEPQRITVSPTGSVVTVTYTEDRNDRWSKDKKKVEKYRTSDDQDVSDLRYTISLFIRSIKSAAKDEGRTVPDYKKAQEIKGIYGYKKNSGKPKRRRNGGRYQYRNYIDFLYDDIQHEVQDLKDAHDQAVLDALQDWEKTSSFQKMLKEVQQKEMMAGDVYATYDQMESWWQSEWDAMAFADLEELYALAFLSMRGDGMGLWENRRPWHSYFEKYLMQRKDYTDKYYDLEEAAWTAQQKALDEE